MDTTKAPEPGIYPEVSFEEYCAWDCLNNSGAGHLLRSPAHYRAYLAGEDDDSKAKARGTVCHAAILEPARFDAVYAIGPDVRLNTKAGKDEWQAFVDANSGKSLVRGADGDAMRGVREAVWAHEFARKLLTDKGACELSIVWDCKETGVRWKARIDKLAETYSFAVDMKTTRDARPEPFSKAACDYGYFRQAAVNLRGLAALGLPIDGFAIVAVEADPPYGIVVYEVDQDDIEAGWADAVEAAECYRACRACGRWPSYPGGAMPLQMPEWRRRRAMATA